MYFYLFFYSHIFLKDTNNVTRIIFSNEPFVLGTKVFVHVILMKGFCWWYCKGADPASYCVISFLLSINNFPWGLSKIFLKKEQQ